MGIRRVGSLALLLTVACLVGAPACGGGGGGGDGAPAVAFLGTYQYAELRGFTSPSDVCMSNWGTLTARADGTFRRDVTGNGNGVVDGPYVYDTGTYVLAADRALRWGDTGTYGEDVARGGVSADGRVVVLGSVTPWASPALFLLTRRDAGVPPAPTGQWFLAGFQRGVGVVDHDALVGSVLFQAGGVLSATLARNRDGVVTTGLYPTGTHLTGADGTVDLILSGEQFLGGPDRPDDLLVVQGSTVDGERPMLFFLSPWSAGVPSFALAGSWFAAGLEYDPGDRVYVASTGTVTVDAAGLMTYDLEQNDDGVYRTATGTGVCSSSPDGSVLVTISGGPTLLGGLSPGLDRVCLAGGIGAGTNPVLMFLVRR